MNKMINKTDYYHFNAFSQLKAYSENGEKFAYYGYDAGGERTYRMKLNVSEVYNSRLGGKFLDVEKVMYYPSGYISITQNGEYTKHYYVDAQRIASKIGSGSSESIGYNADSVQSAVLLEVMKKELGILLTGDTIEDINYPANWGKITHLQGNGNYEDGLFFWHGNNLSSTSLITDISGNITQAVLYTAWRMPITEYRQDWMLDTIPQYLFCGKEKDTESGLYYMEARYYSDEDMVFRGRDQLFEKFYWLSPYAYCMNNPLRWIDPTGMEPGDPLKTMQVRQNSVKNTFGPVRHYKDGSPKPHQGIDYYAPAGTDVYAVQNGKVVKINDNDNGDYGKYIIIQHHDKDGKPQKNEDGKDLYSFYGHLSEISVGKNDKVTENETIIGKSGNTGNAKNMKGDDEHLHFEIRTDINLGKGLDGRLDPNLHVDTKYKIDPNNSQKVIMIE